MSQICIFDMSFKISNKICALCLTIYDSMIIAQATSENNNKVSTFSRRLEKNFTLKILMNLFEFCQELSD